VLSLAHVDHLLTETAIRAPAVRVARNGSVLPESSFTRGGSLDGQPLTGLVDPVRLMRLHDEGATLMLARLDGKIAIDFATARRLFTLVCVLHQRV